jgi:hypothetical protein
VDTKLIVGGVEETSCKPIRVLFTIKGAKDYAYMHKILHPLDFEK